MPWSLSYREYEPSKNLDQFLQKVGRCLYIGSTFEWKCRILAELIQVLDETQRGTPIDAAGALVEGLKRANLNSNIQRLRNSFPNLEAGMDALDEARKARNWIAHDAARFGPLDSISDQDIEERDAELARQILPLLRGDAVISRWAYVVTERNTSSTEVEVDYEARLLRWVAGADLI